MPVVYEIDLQNKIVHMTGSGRLTDEELVDCVSSLRNDPDLLPEMPTISDLTAVTEMDLTFEGFKGVSEILALTDETLGKARVTVVIARRSDDFMGKLFTSIDSWSETRTKLQVFRDRAEAEAWIRQG